MAATIEHLRDQRAGMVVTKVLFNLQRLQFQIMDYLFKTYK